MRLPVAALLAASLAVAAAPNAAHAAFNVINNGATSFRIDSVDNPTLTLHRGTTYTFNVNASGHPFYIKTAQVTGTGSQYTTGVTGNGTQVGTLTWTVANNAPATLFYNCQFHEGMTGQIDITDPVPAVTPVTGAALALLLAGAGLVVARRRMAARA
jgi:hypothetical protein